MFAPHPGWSVLYTVCCTLFTLATDRKKMGVMANHAHPCTEWRHKSDVIGKYTLKPWQQRATQDAEMLLQSIEQLQTATWNLLNKMKADSTEKNRHILKSVAKAVCAVLLSPIHCTEGWLRASTGYDWTWQYLDVFSWLVTPRFLIAVCIGTPVVMFLPCSVRAFTGIDSMKS